MHILGRIKPTDDPWQKVALLSLQQLTEDMSINDKRIRALEMSVMVLSDLLGRSHRLEQQDLGKVTAMLQELHDEIGVWSKRSLDRTEDLVVAIKQLAAYQQFASVGAGPGENERLAS